MYLQKVPKKQKTLFFVGLLKVNDKTRNPDPLVKGMDPRIWIHTKMSWICNTGMNPY
jgi:hypothetical protein